MSRAALVLEIEGQLSALSDAELIDVHNYVGDLMQRSHRFTTVIKHQVAVEITEKATEQSVDAVIIYCACGWRRTCLSMNEAVLAHEEHRRTDG